MKGENIIYEGIDCKKILKEINDEYYICFKNVILADYSNGQ